MSTITDLLKDRCNFQDKAALSSSLSCSSSISEKMLFF